MAGPSGDSNHTNPAFGSDVFWENLRRSRERVAERDRASIFAEAFASDLEPDPAEERGPTAEEIAAAVPRLRSALDAYREAGKLKGAVGYWKSRAKGLGPIQRAAALVLLRDALAEVAEGEAA
jgi:hypothetical protein